MARKNQVEIVVNSRTEGDENLERVAKTLDGLAAKGGDGAEKASSLAAELRKLQQQQQLVVNLSAVTSATDDLSKKLEEAKSKSNNFNKELKATANPTIALKRNTESAAKAVKELENRLAVQKMALGAAQNSYKQAGLSVRSLDENYKELSSALLKTRISSAEFIKTQEELNQKNTQAGGILSQVKLSYLALAAAFGGVARKVFNTTLVFDSNYRALKALTGSATEAAKEMEFVKRSATALGTPIQEATKAYTGLMAATKGTKLEGDQTRKIFLNVSFAMSALGRSSDETAGAFLALQQMISKGKVQAEELRGQLGERIPGAFQIFAKSMGVSTQELDKMLETGRVLSEDVLPKFAQALADNVSGSELDGLQVSLNRIQNTFDTLSHDVGSVLIPPIAEFFSWLGIIAAGVVSAFEILGLAIATIFAQIAAFDLSRPIESLKEFDAISEKTFNETLAKAAKRINDAKNNSKAFGDESVNSSKRIAKELGNTEEAVNKLAKADQDLLALEIDRRNELIRISVIQKTYFDNLEKENKAQIEAARAEEKLAKAKNDTNAAAEARAKISALEADQNELRVSRDQTQLAMLEEQRKSLLATKQVMGELSEGRQKALDDLEMEISALKGVASAHELNAQAARANAEESEKAASRIEQAFKRLNMVSQAEQTRKINEAKQAYEDLSAAASKGIVSQEDAKQAFMAYAKEVVEQSKNAASAQVKAKNDVALASLRAKAETMGLGAEFAKLEGVATQAGDVASASMEKVAESSKKAAEGVAGIGSFLEENMVRGTTEVTKLVPVIVAQAAAQINSLGEKARAEFVKMHGDLEGLIEKGTAADDIEAMTKRINQLGAEMSTLSHYSVRTGDHIGNIAAAAKGAEIAVLEQKRALAQMTEQMQRTNGESQKLPISLESIASRFDKLDDADLSNLKSEIQRINGELEETKNAAKEATEQLEDMINAAKDDLDRDAGNIEAIEKRKLAKDLAKIDEQVADGGDKAKAEELKRLLKHASDKRIIEERERQKAEKAREKEQAEQKRQQALAEKEQQAESKKQQSSSSESGSTARNNRSSPTSTPQSSEPTQEVVRVVRFDLPNIGSVHLKEDEAAMFERFKKQFVDDLNRQSRISM